LKTALLDEDQEIVFMFMTALLTYCVATYRSDFVLRSEQYSLIIAIVSTFYVCGVTPFESESALLGHCYQILSQNPIVPLVAELNFLPGDTVRGLSGFSPPGKWPIITDAGQLKAIADKYMLTKRMGRLRELFKEGMEHISVMSHGESLDINSLCQLLQSLSEMASGIIEQFAFKCACPATSKGGGLYDSQVRNNHSLADCDALIEAIGQMKTLATLALQVEPNVIPFVEKYVAQYVQRFVQYGLDGALVAAHRQPVVVVVIVQIRNIFGHWGVQDLPDRDCMKRDVEDACVVPPSPHQLEILRLAIQSLYTYGGICTDAKRDSLYKFVKRPQFRDAMKKFVRETRGFSILLNYPKVIREITNLGSLWFRERSLDIERKTQYPVRSSLPFILSEHILHSENRPALNDSVFFPFEIYNDAAHQAISLFKSQFLYKEVEAEVCLCVEMISSTFSDAFYKFLRRAAAIAFVPPECVGMITPLPVRYGLMVKQNSLHLLGSPVDFNLVATRLINRKTQQEIEKCLQVITDWRCLPFYAHIFQVMRLTHEFLVRDGLRLDDFDTIWKRAVGGTDPLSPATQVVTTLLAALDASHLMFHSVSRRFFNPKPFQLVPPSNEEWASVYANCHKTETCSIGSEHVSALCQIMSATEIALFARALLDKISMELLRSMAIFDQVAPRLRLLQTKGQNDAFAYFRLICDTYAETRHPMTGPLFNSMRHAGNLTALLWAIECEIPPRREGFSLSSSIAQIYLEVVKANKEVFIPADFDCDNQVSHRTFPSLWPILEFLLCSPNPVMLTDSVSLVRPLTRFGTGPVVCAHMLIAIAGQSSLYQYDAIVPRQLSLYDIQKTVLTGDFANFVQCAIDTGHARSFAETMAHPYLGLDLSD
jgi:cytoplasmic FMR1 interacting protein